MSTRKFLSGVDLTKTAFSMRFEQLEGWGGSVTDLHMWAKSDTARIVGVDRTVVLKMLNRYQDSGLPWPIPENVSDAKLKEVVYPSAKRKDF